MTLDTRPSVDLTRSAMLSAVPVFLGVIVGGLLIVAGGSILAALLGLAVIGLTFMFSEIRGIKLALLTVLLLEVPLQIDRYFNHDVTEAATSAISGYNVSLTTLGLIGLYLLWIAEAFSGVSPPAIPVLRKALPAAAFVGVAAFSFLYAGSSQLAGYELTILVQALMLLVYVGMFIRTPFMATYAVAVLVFGVLLQTVLGTFALIGGSTFEISIVTIEIAGDRLAGTLGHPNSLGAYMAMMLPLAAALVLMPVSRWLRYMAGTAFIGGSIMLALSQSRGGFLGYVVGLVALAGLAYAYRLVPRAILLRGGAIALVPLTIQIAIVGSRLTSINDAAAQSRLPLLDLAWTVIRDNPLLGVGANNFAFVLDRYLTIDFNAAWIDTVHNKYLLVWSELGLLGLAAFLWLLIATLIRAHSVVRSPNRPIALIAAGAFAGVLGSSAHMLVDIYNGRSLVQMLFIICGLVIAVSTHPDMRRGEQSASVGDLVSRDRHSAR